MCNTTEQRGNLAGLVPNFGKPPTPTIKQRLFELKQRAEIKHAYWKPTTGETIVGEVLAYDTPLVIKTEDDQIIKIFFGSMDTPVTNRDGEYLVKEGDLVAVTYNGVKPPYGVKEYSVLIDKVAH